MAGNTCYFFYRALQGVSGNALKGMKVFSESSPAINGWAIKFLLHNHYKHYELIRQHFKRTAF